ALDAGLVAERLQDEQLREVLRALVVQLSQQLGEAASVRGVAERRQFAYGRQQPQQQRLADVVHLCDHVEVDAPRARARAHRQIRPARTGRLPLEVVEQSQVT